MMIILSVPRSNKNLFSEKVIVIGSICICNFDESINHESLCHQN